MRLGSGLVMALDAVVNLKAHCFWKNYRLLIHVQVHVLVVKLVPYA